MNKLRLVASVGSPAGLYCMLAKFVIEKKHVDTSVLRGPKVSTIYSGQVRKASVDTTLYNPDYFTQ